MTRIRAMLPGGELTQVCPTRNKGAYTPATAGSVRALNSTTRLAAELRVDLAEVEGKDHFAENELSVEATTLPGT